MLSHIRQGVTATARRGFVAMGVVAAGVLLSISPAFAQAPDPSPQAPPGVEDAANTFISWLKWGVLAGGVVGLLICSGMMILGRRNRSTTAVDGATGIPWVFGGLSLAAVGAGIVGQILK